MSSGLIAKSVHFFNPWVVNARYPDGATALNSAFSQRPNVDLGMWVKNDRANTTSKFSGGQKSSGLWAERRVLPPSSLAMNSIAAKWMSLLTKSRLGYFLRCRV